MKKAKWDGIERRRWDRSKRRVIRPDATCDCHRKDLGVLFRPCPKHGWDVD